MRTIYIISISFLSLFLMSTSCERDEGPINIEYSIYEKWYHKEMVINGIVEPYDGNEPCGKDYIEFYDTNKVKEVDITLCEPVINMSGTFTRSGQFLIIIDEHGDEFSPMITELTETSFIIKYNDDYDNNGTSDVIEERYAKN